ncbi:MAG: hypothetical protein ACOC33_00015 [bacterium]
MVDLNLYRINDNQERIYAILPVSLLLTGQKWAHLKSDLPELFSSYSLRRISSISAVSSLSVEDLHNYFLIRGEDFWTQIIDLMIDCENAMNPDCQVWGMEIFIEADKEILTTEVPDGIHGSEKFDESGNTIGQMTFQEWNAGGDQPIATNTGDTKVIIRTNISGVVMNQHEVLIMNEFINNSNLNAKFLNKIQYMNLIQSKDYSQPNDLF